MAQFPRQPHHGDWQNLLRSRIKGSQFDQPLSGALPGLFRASVLSRRWRLCALTTKWNPKRGGGAHYS